MGYWFLNWLEEEEGDNSETCLWISGKSCHLMLLYLVWAYGLDLKANNYFAKVTFLIFMWHDLIIGY